MNQNDFRAEFEINEADMRLQWQFTAFLSKVVHHARCDYLRKEQRNRARMVSQDTDNKSMAENTADPKAQERLEGDYKQHKMNGIQRLTEKMICKNFPNRENRRIPAGVGGGRRIVAQC